MDRQVSPVLFESDFGRSRPTRSFGDADWKCDDFRGPQGKLNIRVAALGTRPLFRWFTNDGRLEIYVSAADKSAVAKATWQTAVSALIGQGVLPTPPATASDAVELDFPQWWVILDGLEAGLAGLRAGRA